MSDPSTTVPALDTYTDPLRVYQQRIVDQLRAFPELMGIPVLAEEKGDLVTSIETQLAKLGICIVVEMIPGAIGYAGAHYTLTATVGLSIFENVLLNRSETGTRRTASEILAAVIRCQAPANGGLLPIVDADLESDSDGIVAYSLSGKCKVSIPATRA